MTRGQFITIEGSEGAGKSTALQFVHDYLQQFTAGVVMTREPGGTELGEEIRKVLLHPTSKEMMAANTELLLMFAARAQHISKCIQPALHAGKWVVSDRYVDASYAYQGGGRGIAVEQINMLDKFIVGNLYPDLTLLLDVPVDIGFARAERRGADKDRIEQEKKAFFFRVRQAYLERAKQDPERIKLIDASQALPAVQAEIRHVLASFIASKSV